MKADELPTADIERFGYFLKEMLAMYNAARGRKDEISQNNWALKVLGFVPSRVSNWMGRSLPDPEGLDQLASVLLKEYNKPIYANLTGRQQELVENYKDAGMTVGYMRKFGVGTWAYKACYRLVGKREPISDDPRATEMHDVYVASNEEGRRIIWNRFQQALDDLNNFNDNAGTVKGV